MQIKKKYQLSANTIEEQYIASKTDIIEDY